VHELRMAAIVHLPDIITEQVDLHYLGRQLKRHIAANPCNILDEFANSQRQLAGVY
jgi:hypothetical protein